MHSGTRPGVPARSVRQSAQGDSGSGRRPGPAGGRESSGKNLVGCRKAAQLPEKMKFRLERFRRRRRTEDAGTDRAVQFAGGESGSRGGRVKAARSGDGNPAVPFPAARHSVEQRVDKTVRREQQRGEQQADPATPAAAGGK